MAEWIKNPDPTVCCLLCAALFRFKDTGRLKVKEWKNIPRVNHIPCRFRCFRAVGIWPPVVSELFYNSL